MNRLALVCVILASLLVSWPSMELDRLLPRHSTVTLEQNGVESLVFQSPFYLRAPVRETLDSLSPVIERLIPEPISDRSKETVYGVHSDTADSLLHDDTRTRDSNDSNSDSNSSMGKVAQKVAVRLTFYIDRGKTRWGCDAGPGIASTDPTVILPMTRFRVVGWPGEWLACDTGGGVLGAWVDVWMPSMEAGREFTRVVGKYGEIEILE